MKKEKLKRLISSEGLIFFPIGEESVTVEELYSLTSAFCNKLKEKFSYDSSRISVAVGFDGRDFTENVITAIKKSAYDTGAFVYDCEKTFLSALFMTTVSMNVSGCIFVCLCEKKEKKIKIELMTRYGRLTVDEMVEIVDEMCISCNHAEETQYEYRKEDSLKFYSEFLRQEICKNANATDYSRPLRGVKFVLDTNGGIGNFIIDKVLLPLGAEVVEVRGEEMILKECRNVSANVGIIFDYDMEKIRIVSREFGVLPTEAFTSLVSQISCEENKECTIMTNYPVTGRMKKTVAKNNICDFICKDLTRYELVQEQKQLTEDGVNCVLSIGKGGFCSFKANNCVTDAAYVVALLSIKIISLRQIGKRIDDLIMPYYNVINEFKITINSFDKEGYANTVMTAFEGYCLKRDDWYTTVGEKTITNKTENYFFVITNDSNNYLKITLRCKEQSLTYNVLLEIYNYFKQFSSLIIDEIGMIF